MVFYLNSFLRALAFALDFVEIDYLGATSNHSRRITYISQRLAEYFDLSEDERIDLFSFTVLHDNGLSEDVLLNGIKIDNPEIDRPKLLEEYTDHCDIGEENVKNFPFLTDNRNIIRYHHEKFDGSGHFGISGKDFPVLAQIIALADTVDNLYHFETQTFENREHITNFIRKNRGSCFSPDLADAFLEISYHTSFWLDLREPFIYRSLNEQSFTRKMDIPVSEIYNITKVFSKIIDSKSKFTSTHTSGLLEKTGTAADYYGFSPDRKTKLLIAASLHDLGKLAVPNRILDKPGKLTKEEFSIIRSHTYYTRAALNRIYGFDDICGWASNHHETLDGKGYPYGLKSGSLDFESRLLACLDIYQALTEDRPYREGMSHRGALKILNQSAESGKIDREISYELNKIFS